VLGEREPVDLRSCDYSQATRCCDIVMKGGITSGVVYPHAVCELARTFRLKNVGGTSAGAIAAAATAAAEYGRAGGGFNALADLPDWIGAPGNLPGLFQPQPAARGLFAVLMAKVEHGWGRAIAVAAWRNILAVAFGALLGVPLIVLGLQWPTLLAVVACLVGALLSLLGAAVAVALRLLAKLARAVPDNDYGLCSGWSANPRPGRPPLTTWLYGKLNEYAGIEGEPLTFGHLWAGPGKDRANPPEGEERHVQLAMMTTNLTNRRSHRLPWDSEGWLFCPAEFGGLFPAEVVEWMEDHAGDPVLGPEGQTLRPLPQANDMPVIVTTRLSLSFPVLLSAVPLWRMKRNTGPVRCLFSDGGISSNFPVHFFDGLVPRWPTFAINLRPFLSDDEESEEEYENTWMVEAEEEWIDDWWNRLPKRRRLLPDGRLRAFLTTILQTMQNQTDEGQMRVPGYRDRVAHVNLRKEQGGMNLAMKDETIEALTERGRWAAARLAAAYDGDPDRRGVTWDSHRWVRLRSALSVLEDLHGGFVKSYGAAVEPEDAPSYDELLERSGFASPPNHRWWDEAQKDLAAAQVVAVHDAVAATSDSGTSVAPGSPQPPPEGRIKPRD
jgi:predicted acylesterase/phospholipase RssA